MPTRADRLRREANRRRREQEAAALAAAGAHEEEISVEQIDHEPMPEDDALHPEALLPEGEAMAPEGADVPPATPDDGLSALIEELTPEQATMLERLLAARRPVTTTPPLVSRPLPARPDSLTHWARFTLPDVKFFTYYGTNYDRGQLLVLVGGPRDEQLVRMGFVEVALKSNGHLRAQCGVCGCWFLTEQFRDMHGQLRHAERFQDDLDIGGGMHGPHGGAALRDVTGDAEERRMQQQYPLYLDRTKATLESGGA